MASTTDPRAAGFNANEFRDAIHFAMNMGKPDNVADQATFRWTVQKTFNKADVAGKPFDLTAVPLTVVAHPDVIVPVGVRLLPARLESNFTDMGSFDPIRAIITVLDVDYVSIEGADQVLLGQNTYVIEFIEPPVALFSVTVYIIHATSRDES